MTNILVHAFEELPLVIEDGFEAGHISGTAEIRFYDDPTEWHVGDIRVEVWKGKESRLIEVDSKSELYLSIWDLLTSGSFAERIGEKVYSALEEAGELPQTDRAAHSTHYAALSGAH